MKIDRYRPGRGVELRLAQFATFRHRRTSHFGSTLQQFRTRSYYRLHGTWYGAGYD
jgi:hypothetical protein